MNDIPPPSGLRANPTETLSRAAPSPASPRPPPSRMPRRLRLLVALGLLGLAGLALLRQQMIFSTEHAVISATAIPLRSPIGGEVAELAVRPGEAVTSGAMLLRIANPLADRRRLQDAAAERDRARDEMATLAQQLAAIDSIAASLADRAAAHRQEAARMLAAGAVEGEHLLAAAEARARRSALEAGRALDLARGGVASPAQRERAEAERDVALQEAAALAARTAALRVQEAAAGRGFFLAGGYGGVAYLEQRLDEVALRRTELVRQHAAQQAALTRAEQRLAEAAARHAEESAAELRARGDWHAWRVPVTLGQRVSPEEPVAELVDCADLFVLAAVPQSEVPTVTQGQPIRLRLAGESAERAGTVLGWLPEGMAQEGGRLAVLPTRPRGPSSVARIGIAPPAPGEPCPVGRTGRVLFERDAALPFLR